MTRYISAALSFCLCCLVLATPASAQRSGSSLKNGTLTIRHQDRSGNHTTQLVGATFSGGQAVTYGLLIDGQQVETFPVAAIRKVVVLAKTPGVSSVLIQGYQSPDIQIKGSGGGLLVGVGGELGTVSVSGTPKADGVFILPGVPNDQTTQVAGLLKVSTKGGDDTFGVSNALLLGGASINTGGGNDVCFMEQVFAPTNVSVKTGGGNDQAFIGAPERADLSCVFLGRVSFAMGGGNDDLTIGSDITYNASLVTLNGNGGYDELDSYTIDNGIDIRGFDNFLF